MLPRKWLYWSLPAVAIGLVSVSIVGDEELEIGSHQVQPNEPAAPEEIAFAHRAAVVPRETGGADESRFPAPANLRRSQQSLVDERPERLRDPRNAMLDSYSGRGPYMPPWMGAYGYGVEPYRNAMPPMQRRPRDYNMPRHSSLIDAMCPWSNPQRARPRQRGIRMPTDQLGREAARDAWLYGQPYAVTGPAAW